MYRNDSEDEARLREPGPEMGSPSGGSRGCLERPQTFSELWARVSSAQSPEPRAQSRDRESGRAGRCQGKGLEAVPC